LTAMAGSSLCMRMVVLAVLGKAKPFSFTIRFNAIGPPVITINATTIGAAILCQRHGGGHAAFCRFIGPGGTDKLFSIPFATVQE